MEELHELTEEILKILKWFVIPVASLRLGVAYLKYIWGDRKELALAVRQVVIGIVGINGINFIIWLGLRVGESIPDFEIYV